jgi:hypothetical protein
MNNDVSKSWFCVFANPEEHGYSGEPQEIVDKIIEVWIADNPQRTCAVAYCIAADGLKHCHAVFEDTKAMRFTVVKKMFPSMHIEATKGNKDQAEDYINKRGKWEEKGEIIVCINRHGEIKGSQGQRNDLEIIEELLNQGKTPNEILSMSLSYRRFDRIIREAYYQNRASETPPIRDIAVYWHVGASGSGKSYEYVKLTEESSEDNVYMVSDYAHGFDKYNGQPIIFMDEFRGQMPYALLLSLLGGYKVQVPCRYTNVYSLWNEVHITSVLAPEHVYQKMVQENQFLDSIDQLKRRISFVVYHYIENDEYKKLEVPMKDYQDYSALVAWANGSVPHGFVEVADDSGDLPFTKPDTPKQISF